MKKNHVMKRKGWEKVDWKELFLVLSIFCACFSSPKMLVGQTEQRVTLTMKQVLIEQVFRRLQETTRYRFTYLKEDLPGTPRKDYEFSGASIQEVMDELLKGTNLQWKFQSGAILVSKVKAENPMKKKFQRVSGKVLDSNKQPILGVTLLIKGTSVGGATDAQGEFVLDILPQEELSIIFSFIGMKTQEVSVKNDKPLLIIMEEEAQQIDEVVITGYQSMKKTSMAGSASSVRAEDLLLNGTQTLEQALQGHLPGVSIVNQSGLTGTRQKVRVRGTSTLVGNAEPVWVVDGIIQEDPLPFNASELTDIGDNGSDVIKNFVGGAISWLNPNDIDNIVVLKDASATSIYGVKAANGVIVITTKKGERGRLTLSYSGNFSVSSKMNYRKLELMNSKERVDASREAFNNGAVLRSDEPIGYMALATAYRRREISYDEFNAGVKRLEVQNTDWFDILFQTPFSHSHSVNVSGGSDKTTYRGSFGYNDSQNTAKGNSRKSYTANLLSV